MSSNAINRLECYIDDQAENLESFIKKFFFLILIGLGGTVLMLGLFLKKINDRIISLQESRHGSGNTIEVQEQPTRKDCKKPNCINTSVKPSLTHLQDSEKVGPIITKKPQATSYHTNKDSTYDTERKPLSKLNRTLKILNSNDKLSCNDDLNKEGQAKGTDDETTKSSKTSCGVNDCLWKPRCTINYKKEMGRPPDLSNLPTTADLKKHHLSRTKQCNSCLKTRKLYCSTEPTSGENKRC